MPRIVHNNNSFDLIRLVLALFVIVTHSYAILGLPEHDLLYKISNGQTRFSVFAVDSFFVISGYLIMRSLINSPGVIPYLIKRVLRIVPAYWAAIILSVVILAFLTSSVPFETITSRATMVYILNTMLFRVHYYIPEVLNGNAINGSLWTIPYEALCYIMIVPFFWIRQVKIRVLVLLSWFLLFYVISFEADEFLKAQSLPIVWLNLYEVVRLGMLFIAGALMTFIRVKNEFSVLMFSISILAISMLFQFYQYIQPIVLPVFLIALGLRKSEMGTILTSKGDFSYGIYLWAFPIQQALHYFYDFQNPIVLTLFTVPLAYVFGMMSWFIIEKRFLALKSLLGQNWKEQKSSSNII